MWFITGPNLSGPNTFTGQQTFNRAHTDGAAETIFAATVDDDPIGLFKLSNGTATNTVFFPLLTCASAGNGSALTIIAQQSTDPAGQPAAFVINARIASGPAAIAVRPLFDIQNNAVSMLQLLPLNSGASACLSFGLLAGANPTFTTRSAGNRFILGGTLDSSNVENAVGFNSGTTWFTTGQATTANNFRFYGGTTLLASLDGKGNLVLTQGAQGGTPTALTVTGGVITNAILSTEAPDVDIALNRTVQFAAGALATQRAVVIRAPTYSFVGNASTITTAATVAITGAPSIAGGSSLITNSSALLIQGGAASGSPTNVYGLTILGPTGGVSNYALNIVATSIASTAETLARFTTSDDAVGKFEIKNQDASDSLFVPYFDFTGNAANYGWFTRVQITTDSGASACSARNYRITNTNPVAVRPLEDVSNNGTVVHRITAAGGVVIQGGTTPSLILGASGTAITQSRVYSQTITPASVGANGSSGCVQTFTVTGLTTADKIQYNHGSAYANGVGDASARCSAADTLEVTYYNTTAGALTPAAGTALILATRS